MKKQSYDTVCFSRARDFYLYSTSGVRYVDLSLNDAQALWGHKPKGWNSIMKQVLDKGLVVNNKQWNTRCQKAIQELFTEWKFIGWYQGIEENILHTQMQTQIVPLLRPYSSFNMQKIAHTSMLFSIPQVWNFTLLALLEKKTHSIFNNAPNILYAKDNFLNGKNAFIKKTKISSVEAVSLWYGLRRLISCGIEHRPLPTQSKNRKDFIILRENTKEYVVKGIDNTKNKYKDIPQTQLELPNKWIQDGIYIYPKLQDKNEYIKIRNVLFEYNFFVPSYQQPWVLPPYFTKQELKNWEMAISKI